MLENYQRLYDAKPKEFISPMVNGDHPELDDSPELHDEGIKLYQSLIGSLQWSVTLGRFKIKCEWPH